MDGNWQVISHEAEDDRTEHHARAALVGAEAAQEAARRTREHADAAEQRVRELTKQVQQHAKDSLARLEERAEQTFAAVDRVGREAVGEMQRLASEADQTLADIRAMAKGIEGTHAAILELARSFRAIVTALEKNVVARKRIVRDKDNRIIGIETVEKG